MFLCDCHTRSSLGLEYTNSHFEAAVGRSTYLDPICRATLLKHGVQIQMSIGVGRCRTNCQVEVQGNSISNRHAPWPPVIDIRHGHLRLILPSCE